MSKVTRIVAWGFSALFVAVACGPRSPTGGQGGAGGDAGHDAGSSAGSGGTTSDAAADVVVKDAAEAGSDGAIRDCSSQRWGNVNDACFNCLCSRCASQLSRCDEGCLGILSCSVENDLLVGEPADLACEGRSVLATCLKDPAAQSSVTSFILFDGCLINEHHEPTEKLRACEAECGIKYTGDVCERFP